VWCRFDRLSRVPSEDEFGGSKLETLVETRSGSMVEDLRDPTMTNSTLVTLSNQSLAHRTMVNVDLQDPSLSHRAILEDVKDPTLTQRSLVEDLQDTTMAELEDQQVEVETRQVYLIQTQGPEGLTNTEVFHQVVITDLGEIGENAIVVFEEAVGVGAEEIVHDQELVTTFSEEGELQAFPDMETIKIEQDFSHSVKQDLDLGVQYESVEDVHYESVEDVHYESVEDVHLTDPTSVYFNVGVGPMGGMESESETSEVLSLPGSSEELLTEQPLNLVKKDRKRKPSSIDGNSDVVICKLCNSYVVQSMIDIHNRDVHGNMDRLVCPDCGKLFTSKRSLFGHKKEKHTGPVEIYPCPDCGKNFSRKSNLKAHRDSLHFGKKFPCSFCDRIFTNRSSMNQHIKKTHTEPVMSL